MKKIYFAFSALLFATAAHSQSKTVILNVEHRIGIDTCATGVEGINNLGNPFKLNRIQYYMDEIILVHDGGSSDTAAALALVDGFNETSLNLGTFTVDSLESIRFAI